jgi:hypothetical protein
MGMKNADRIELTHPSLVLNPVQEMAARAVMLIEHYEPKCSECGAGVLRPKCLQELDPVHLVRRGEVRVIAAYLDRYLGVLTLLGQLAEKVPATDGIGRYGIERAFSEANTLMAERGSTIRYAKTNRGGYAAFEVPCKKTPVPKSKKSKTVTVRGRKYWRSAREMQS